MTKVSECLRTPRGLEPKTFQPRGAWVHLSATWSRCKHDTSIPRMPSNQRPWHFVCLGPNGGTGLGSKWPFLRSMKTQLFKWSSPSQHWAVCFGLQAWHTNPWKLICLVFENTARRSKCPSPLAITASQPGSSDDPLASWVPCKHDVAIPKAAWHCGFGLVKTQLWKQVIIRLYTLLPLSRLVIHWISWTELAAGIGKVDKKVIGCSLGGTQVSSPESWRGRLGPLVAYTSAPHLGPQTRHSATSPRPTAHEAPWGHVAGKGSQHGLFYCTVPGACFHARCVAAAFCMSTTKKGPASEWQRSLSVCAPPGDSSQRLFNPEELESICLTRRIWPGLAKGLKLGTGKGSGSLAKANAKPKSASWTHPKWAESGASCQRAARELLKTVLWRGKEATIP